MDLLEELPGMRFLILGGQEAGGSVSPADPRLELVCSKDVMPGSLVRNGHDSNFLGKSLTRASFPLS